MKDTLDKIQHLAGCIRQDIGHIRNGANVTPEELWSANESSGNINDLYQNRLPKLPQMRLCVE